MGYTAVVDYGVGNLKSVVNAMEYLGFHTRITGESKELELADAIVDIVETGSTLRENGLEVVEEVAPISARVIVNLASAKLKKQQIQRVIGELERGLEE